jgi:phosphate transport system substrate-binding protein
MKTRKTITLVAVISLMALLLAGTTSVAALSGKLTIAGSTSVAPYVEALAKLFMAKNPGVKITIESIGSGMGIEAAMQGTAAIGMSSRELKDEEKSLKEYELCLDGIAIITSQSNPIKGLTKAQARDIFLGKITDWKAVGGNAGKINLYTRESTSGTRGAFEELVLGKDSKGAQLVIDEEIYAAVMNSTGQLAQAVSGDKNAIGYISLGTVASYKVNALSIDSVGATMENLAKGTYKIARPFLLLTKGDAKEPAKSFLEYCLTSKEAKDYLRSKSFIVK